MPKQYTDSKKKMITRIIKHDPSYSYILLEPEKYSRYTLNCIWYRIKKQEAKKKNEQD